MNKKNFTLDDIEYFLEDLSFIWLNRIVYNPNNNKYKELKLNTFNGKPKFLSLKNKINGNRILMLTEIGSETFILSADRCKIDASADWKEFLNKKLGNTNEC